MKKSIIFIIVICFSGVWIAKSQTNNSGSGKVRIAACQFPVSGNLRSNYKYITDQIIEAKLKKADAVHFCECALSGYPGEDMKTLENFDWNQLYQYSDSIIALADKLNIWVILGSIHRLSGNNKPHNSLYVINPDGQIIDRYDKRFCTASDLKYCTPGDHFVTFRINGVNCGLLICYDVRFPELAREYRKLGVDLIFHSFYNARAGKESIHSVIMPISAQAHAATNYFYISLTNSSEPESWPCQFITPDGLIQNMLPYNIPGILISNVDISEKYYDASEPFRSDAMNGKLNSGTAIHDSLSVKRTSIH